MPVTTRSFHHSEHMGQLFYFCGAGCKAQFAANTLRYTAAPATNDPEQAVQQPAGKWHMGWWLALVGLVALVMGGLWMA